jgi:hypothetical protein
MIINHVKKLIQITENNIFVQAKDYGVSGIVDNWLTKLFSSNITDNFDNLISAIDQASKDLDIKIISKKDNEEILNRAIQKCKQDDGACIVNIFFDAVNQIIALLIDKYVNTMDIKLIANVSTFEELAQTSDSVVGIYKAYIDSINPDNFNKFFFKIRGATIDATFIRSKLIFLDNYTVTAINNKNGKRVSVSSR